MYKLVLSTRQTPAPTTLLLYSELQETQFKSVQNYIISA